MDKGMRIGGSGSRRVWYVIIALCLLGIVALISINALPRDKDYLPNDVQAKIKDFTPYFFKGAIPAGYSVDYSSISFNNNVLFVALTKNNSPQLVLTEQYMPASLDSNNIQQNSEKVNNTTDPATVNNIEGRMLGTMVATGNKTLIFINGSGNSNKDDIVALLQALKPLR